MNAATLPRAPHRSHDHTVPQLGFRGHYPEARYVCPWQQATVRPSLEYEEQLPRAQKDNRLGFHHDFTDAGEVRCPDRSCIGTFLHGDDRAIRRHAAEDHG